MTSAIEKIDAAFEPSRIEIRLRSQGIDDA